MNPVSNSIKTARHQNNFVMNPVSISEFLSRAAWRLKVSWHYLFAIAVTQIFLVIYTALTARSALVAFLLLIACFALIDSPLETSRKARKHKKSSRKKNRPKEAEIFSNVIEALPDPMLILNPANKLVVANHQARTLFEITQTGQDISAIVRAPHLLEAVSRVASSREKERVHLQTRVPIERQFMVNIAWVTKERAKGPAILVHLRDLSEQERLNRMRADFIANASHELRTPLSSLLGFIETLQGPARDDEAARDKFLAVMATQGRRMKRLIDDLLSLSRVEMNVHQQPSDRIDVVAIISNTVDIVAPIAREQQITIEWQPPAEPVYAFANRDEIAQVLQNLIHNAIKYGRENGFVKITIEDDPLGQGLRRRFAIKVEDDGIGIDAHHIPRLTERFYRVDVEQSRQKGGTGLGLAIAKHILTHHRGELKVQSTLGEGSTFTIFLPKA